MNGEGNGTLSPTILFLYRYLTSYALSSSKSGIAPANQVSRTRVRDRVANVYLWLLQQEKVQLRFLTLMISAVVFVVVAVFVVVV
jgi:hypothetical protein